MLRLISNISGRDDTRNTCGLSGGVLSSPCPNTRYFDRISVGPRYLQHMSGCYLKWVTTGFLQFLHFLVKEVALVLVLVRERCQKWTTVTEHPEVSDRPYVEVRHVELHTTRLRRRWKPLKTSVSFVPSVLVSVCLCTAFGASKCFVKSTSFFRSVTIGKIPTLGRSNFTTLIRRGWTGYVLAAWSRGLPERNSLHFMEPEGSLPHSQGSAAWPYP